MFYVSSIFGSKIGITDTSDNNEEFYSNEQLYNVIKASNVLIYGAFTYNNKVECTALKYNINASRGTLLHLIEAWKRVHNPWTGHPVEDYLAMSKIGTKIDAIYKVKVQDQEFKEKVSIRKTGEDKWLYISDSSMLTGESGNSLFGAWVLEVACIYSGLIDLTVY